MSETNESEQRDPPDADPSAEEEGLSQLRKLLVGSEQEELRELRREVDEREIRADEVSNVLPEAVLLRSKDRRLADALAPTIESAIETSVKKNPQTLADAIFPVIGPAIRKSIRQTFAALMENVNRSIEYGLSPKGLRWRFEAWRTKRPFAEIVLQHSLVFRVEQVFLVHTETSLLLEHVAIPTVSTDAGDMISSLLGAIQDFVSDSFATEGEQAVEQIEFGELVLEVARGPKAFLACLVRGVPQHAIRVRLQETIERIHADKATELADFDGDTLPFSVLRPDLEELLVEKQATPAKGKGKSKSKVGSSVVALGAIGLLLLFTLLAWRSVAETRRWRRALEGLRSEPGLVLAQHSREDGRYVLGGLRDPLARDPLDVVAEAGLDPERVVARFQPFQSLEPSLVVARVRATLEPPPTVRVDWRDGGVSLSGSAPHTFVVQARTLAGAFPGFRWEDERLVDLDLEEADRAAQRLQSVASTMLIGGEVPRPGTPGAAELVRLMHDLEAKARAAEALPRIEVVPPADFDESVRVQSEALLALFREASGGGVAIAAGAPAQGAGTTPGSFATLRVELETSSPR